MRITFIPALFFSPSAHFCIVSPATTTAADIVINGAQRQLGQIIVHHHHSGVNIEVEYITFILNDSLDDDG